MNHALLGLFVNYVTLKEWGRGQGFVSLKVLSYHILYQKNVTEGGAKNNILRDII